MNPLFAITRRAALLAIATAFVILPQLSRAEEEADESRAASARPVSAYETLGNQIRAILEVGGDDASPDQISALVIDPRHDITIFERNADVGMPLGSLTKLFTLAAAYDLLGPEFRFKTELFATGEIKKRTLHGALIVRGDGDPTMKSYAGKRPDLLYATFDQWAKELHAQKIKEIRGPLIVDDSKFDATPFGSGWTRSEPSDPNVPWVSALNFNENIGEIFWLAKGKEGNTAQFETLPDLEGGFLISNSVKLTHLEATGRTYTYPTDFRFINVRGSHRIGAEAHDRILLLEPALYYGVALKERLKDEDIIVTGPVTRWHPTWTLDGQSSRHVAMRISKSLSEMTPEILLGDRHLDAETLYKRLGAERSGATGTFDNGKDAVMDYATRAGIGKSNLLLIDGSGLSTYNKASPRRLVEFMRSLRNSSFAAEFTRAMPGLSQANREPNSPPHRNAGDLEGWFVPVPGGIAVAGWTLSEGKQPLFLSLMIQSEVSSVEELRAKVADIVRAIGKSNIR